MQRIHIRSTERKWYVWFQFDTERIGPFTARSERSARQWVSRTWCEGKALPVGTLVYEA